jgi:hypothetical protein
MMMTDAPCAGAPGKFAPTPLGDEPIIRETE